MSTLLDPDKQATTHRRAIANLLLAAGVVLGGASCSTSRPGTAGPGNISHAGRDPNPHPIVTRSGPQLLTFDELKLLATNPKPTGRLGAKLDRLFSTPFVDNSAFKRSGLPSHRIQPGLGPSLRISTWNIEKSVRIADAARLLRSGASFRQMLHPEIARSGAAYADAERQRAILAASDVLLLQEMDLGHCRSDYLFAADYLAKQLGMNYAYAPQQLEIDPVHLGLDDLELENMDVESNGCGDVPGNASRYRGVFGVAVLSRFPIKQTQLFQLQTQPYDWYADEAERADPLEKGRKFGTAAVFRVRPVREVKVGGRAFTRVDLHVPGLPNETLTVINVHLEIKTTPRKRQRQLEEILAHMRQIRNPVVMAGDFNSSAIDVSPTSIPRATKRATTDSTNIVSAGLYAANATGMSHLRRVLNLYKNFRDPLAWHLPVILPNRVKGLFNTIEDFRFADGGAFDFRGDSRRSLSAIGSQLANSNQRHFLKGFTFTFSVPRPIGPIGRQRLDWIFVKSFLTHPNARNGSYRACPALWRDP